jgi:hypothetical protein
VSLLIDRDTVNGVSDTFTVFGQITVFASGLAGDDRVEFELVRITAARTAGGGCPPTPVVLPAVIWSAPLRCCGTTIALTADNPYVIVDNPQQVLLRAKLISNDPIIGEKIVWYEVTGTNNVTDRMRGCPCAQGA